MESQKPISVEYKGEIVGDFVADVVVEGKVIVEIKSVQRLVKAHEMQVGQLPCCNRRINRFTR